MVIPTAVFIIQGIVGLAMLSDAYLLVRRRPPPTARDRAILRTKRALGLTLFVTSVIWLALR